ncbi:uncharacterized protein HMPREF1541_00620 [Cyphellophora europaea CBS 101466]|uniref:FAD-binding FR-type domain-containing protein n=1 Tax=Cyphellophora europaea (strain CBS 101466) TaxID=1220924 RepID=W2SCK2_CYPE1|nr:uncharacterized protein HMPREF1541_00620 [Cyphellophora europaea CBS 101466]ETN46436.1 hypothetical protein HMPREF1541_00620 [Cyphellophora europaea CBS 101466]
MEDLFPEAIPPQLKRSPVPNLQILPGTYGSLLNSTKPPPALASAIANGNITKAPNGTFYSGLNGVNLERDRQMTSALSIAILCGVIFVLGLRGWQLFTAHLRRIYCLTATRSQQNYWSYDQSTWLPFLKKHVIYAPLGKKRHNREIQLSKAQNYGTIPGRVHTAVLTFYLVTNLVFCLYLDYKHPTPKVLAELRGRSGMLAVWNMMVLILFAARNNPLIWLLETSFDTFNLFHRWLGRLVILESLIHIFAWYGAICLAKGPEEASRAFTGKPFLQYGLVGTVAMGIILVQSLSPIRHAFYEVFLHLHQFLAFFGIIGVYLHLDIAQLPALPYARAVLWLWMLDRVWRVLRLLYLNFTITGKHTLVIIEALPGEACRLTFQLPRHVEIRPGSHVYAYLPRISWWQSHPFSIAWTNSDSEPPTGVNGARYSIFPGRSPKSPTFLEQSLKPAWKQQKSPTTLSLVAAARTGMTRKIYDMARASPSGCIQMAGLVEGPYAGHASLASYGTVIMFAGGAGITHHLIQIRHLLAGAYADTVATRKIVLVWTVKDTEAFAWIRDWMNEIMAMPGRREMLKVMLYVTRGKEGNFQSANGTLLSHAGRCSPGAVLDEELPSRCGATMVTVCGPGAFADEVRAAVRERIPYAAIDMDEESFTW